MAIAFLAQTSASSIIATLTINKPAGVGPGHCMLAFIRERSVRAIVPPAGWTECAGSPQTTGAGATEITCRAYWRVVDGTEGASFTWTVSAAQVWSGGIVAYTGTDTATPVDRSAGNAGTDGSAPLNVIAPSVTPQRTADMLVCAWLPLNNPLGAGTWTIPAAMTSRIDLVLGAVKVADKLLTTATATGTQQADLAFITGTWCAFSVTLHAPDPAPPPAYGARSGLLVDIEDGAGNRYGPGPLRTVQGSTVTRLLDRAGRVGFEMPLSDPRADIVQAKRTMRVHGLIGGANTDIGIGTIDYLRVDAENENPPLSVEGPDLLGELAYNLVDGLEIYEYDTVSPLDVQNVNDSTNTNTDMPNAYDGNPATFDTATLGQVNTVWLYVRYHSTFDQVIMDLGPQFNAAVSTMQVQYFAGWGWDDVAALVDGTLAGGATLAQDGTMSFTRPNDWVEVEHDGQVGYWLRMRPAALLDLGPVDFREVTIRARVATPNGPALIMAYAPAGWAIDPGGYATTGNSAYYLFEDNTTVLAALVTLAEMTGEHFRLGDGRLVTWLRDDQTASGIRAVQTLSPNNPQNEHAVLITRLEQTSDHYEVVNRVYPTGSGFGAQRVTLAAATSVAPAGYTFGSELAPDGTTRYYIETNGATPRISRAISFDEIQPIDRGASADPEAANQLFQAGLKWLQTHDTAATAYRLSVTKLPALLLPGDTIRVIYRRVIGTYTALNINDDFVILEIATSIDGFGILSADMLISTVDRFPDSDLYTMKRQLTSGARVRRTPHPMTTTGITRALVSLAVVTE